MKSYEREIGRQDGLPISFDVFQENGAVDPAVQNFVVADPRRVRRVVSILTQEHILQPKLFFGDGFQIWREKETNYLLINQQEPEKLIRELGIIALDVPESSFSISDSKSSFPYIPGQPSTSLN